ncbi:MAG: menaquinone biosynthesis protein [Candidatus Eremiobacteraeota bacterium]|nr:menaquinone biosynthesis protein [Candidatus Eremiobacteraeota bacterium]
MNDLRCGRILYTNDLPIYAAFDAGAIPYPGSLHADVPARLNAMLLGGELDLSPVSAFAYARSPEELVLLPDLCIGARREVISVVLVSERPPALLGGRHVYLTKESATGANLCRVLLERRYDVRPNFVEEADPFARASAGEAALLIGDRAIDAALTFPPDNVYDLGVVWHDWTGEQTVFALWAARRSVYERDPQGVRACMHALTDAYTWGRAHAAAVVDAAQRTKPRPAGFYENYYAKLNFTFHAAAQSGFAAFCRELIAIGAIARMPPVTPETIGVAR